MKFVFESVPYVLRKEDDAFYDVFGSLFATGKVGPFNPFLHIYPF